MFGDLVERLHAALRMAADLVAEPDLAARSGRSGVESMHRALDRAEGAVGAWAAAHPHEQARAAVVDNELTAARLQLQTHELTRRRDSVNALHAALRRMRTASSVEALAAQVPREVSALGFHRVLFSWVDQARWVPHSTFTASGPEEARAIMAAGDAPYWHTRDLLESQMIRRRQPMLVHDALSNPNVHLDIQAVMHSTSYVAAPLVRGANVVGFVHADQAVEGDAVDELDRDLVSMFVEGLGLAFERVSMRDELASVKSRLGNQASALRELMTEIDDADAGDVDSWDPHAVLAETAVSNSGSTPAPIASPLSRGFRGEGLTRREEEVFSLLGEGVSNAEIACRLYITEGTAKTHVKHVLRKVGAENRAQAGALFRSPRAQGAVGRE